MSTPRKSLWPRFLLLLFALTVLAHVLVSGRRYQRTTVPLLPEMNRMVGVRFDPSFFYDRGVTARELAHELVPAWKAAGVNTVFFRVYDPTYGASYRTSLPHNSQTDYGKQDLLGYILTAAHEQGMAVYAWIPVLNHRGVWEARTAWRQLRPNKEPYTAEALPFPLCPRHPGVKEWWNGFLDDLLDCYPRLDGIDIAEPVVSWNEGDACFCPTCTTGFSRGDKESAVHWKEYRSIPLSELIAETCRRVRARGKTTVLTMVLPAGADGMLLPFSALKNRTGLDLDQVLSSSDRPDYLSVEFMWQEWAGIFENGMVFNPDWVEQAFRQARRMVAGRSRLLAHLEISDFGAVTVGLAELRASLEAALESGAEGIEVYEASLLDTKNAWGALSRFEDVTKRKQVLVLHDSGGESDAWQIATLCGHFTATVEVKDVSTYEGGAASRYDALFYLGTDARAALPEAFLTDIQAAEIPVVWLNFNIQKLLARTSRYGFILIDSRNDTSFDRVRYRDSALARGEPNVNLVRVSDATTTRVLAELVSAEASFPYTIRSGQFWYFADNPLSYAVEGGNYLVFADQLHEILAEDHRSRQVAVVRIEDVHPLTPPKRLLSAARILHEREVPFLVSIVPFYVFPKEGVIVSLSERPAFVAAVKEAVELGATVVLHGVTHQRTAESTADCEFWDTINDGPPADRSDSRTRSRLLHGLEECFRNGIYPLLWETPHYASSLADYRVFGQVFNTACERRQSSDVIGTDQLYPFVIYRDRFGQLLLPENLGYVPLSSQDAEPVLEAARRTAVVRDPTIAFFFHLFCDHDVLREIVDGIADLGYSFVDVQSLPLSVTGPEFHVCTTAAPIPGNHTDTPSKLFDRSGRLLWEGAGKDLPRNKESTGGVRVYRREETEVAHPQQPASFRLSGDEEFLLRPLQVGVLARPEVAAAVSTAFSAVGAQVTALDPDASVLALPKQVSLLVVGEECAGAMEPTLRSQLLEYARRGGVLLTWGVTHLSEEAGVTATGTTVAVEDILDHNFPESRIRLPAPRLAAAVAITGDAEILSEDRASGLALMAAISLDEGTVLYSAIAPFVSGGPTPYPYFMTTLRLQVMLAPVVRAKRLEVYYDPGLLESVAVEDLVKRWARSGVRTIHVAAWHEYPEWTYEYEHLIELAHQNGILVYAWLALPLVSPRFWEENAAWRTRNRHGDETNVDWRASVSLVDPACLEAVKTWLVGFLGRYDFDGVNLAGLHFGGESTEHPDNYTPFGDAALKDFTGAHGFDPRELFVEGSPHFWQTAPKKLEIFYDWRQAWTTRLHRELLETLAGLPRKPAVVVTTLDGAVQPGRAREAGIAVREILELRRDVPFEIQFMDPGPSSRPRGIEGVRSLLRDYDGLVTIDDLTVNINLGHKYETLPSGRLTGLPLYAALASSAPVPVAIYSEDSIPDADWPFLAPAMASYADTRVTPYGMQVKTGLGLRVSLAPIAGGRPLLNEEKWYAAGSGEILIPPGEHDLTFAAEERMESDQPSIIDASCDLLAVKPVSRGIRFSYDSQDRACLVLDRPALRVSVDGNGGGGSLARGLRGQPLLLPAGRHEVVAITESWSSYAVRLASVLLSSGIVAISVLSLFLVGGLFLWGQWGRRHPQAGCAGNREVTR